MGLATGLQQTKQILNGCSSTPHGYTFGLSAEGIGKNTISQFLPRRGLTE